MAEYFKSLSGRALQVSVNQVLRCYLPETRKNLGVRTPTWVMGVSKACAIILGDTALRKPGYRGQHWFLYL